MVTAALLLGGCATTATPGARAPVLPTATVAAAGETAPVATQRLDAADDPAIFARADNAGFEFAGKPVAGVILGTDKKAGLYIYDLGGAALQFVPDGLLNNVDLRPAGDGFIAGASDRGRMGIALYRFDPAAGAQLVPAGFIKSDVAEPYGFCMGQVDGALLAVLIAKDGQTRVYTIGGAGTALTGTERQRFAIGSQSEGCVVDDATGDLYVGEELKGVWRYSLRGSGERVLIGGVGEGRLVADVEGLTLIDDGGVRYLLASSQGDSAFAVWRLGEAGPVYAGRFRVGAGAGGVDAVTGTDGIDARGGATGPFADGLLVVQDDVNTGGPQNFKLVRWADVRTALGLAAR